jgi:hypothetical protein
MSSGVKLRSGHYREALRDTPDVRRKIAEHEALLFYEAQRNDIPVRKKMCVTKCKEREVIKYAFEILFRHAEEFEAMSKGYVKPIAGGGVLGETIDVLELSLDTRFPLEMEEARHSFVLAWLSCVEDINKLEHTEKKHFRDKDFKAQNYALRMTFAHYDTESSRDKPKLAYVFSIEKEIFYCYRDFETGALSTFHQESLEEAINRAKMPTLKI